MKALAAMVWGAVPNKRQVLMTVACVCVVLSTIGAVLVGVDVPFKGKTVVELWLHDHWENWRHHGNSTKLHLAEREIDVADKECTDLRKSVEDIQILIWKLKAIAKSNPSADMSSELSDMDIMMASKKKELVGAELYLAQITQSFEDLVAAR